MYVIRRFYNSLNRNVRGIVRRQIKQRLPIKNVTVQLLISSYYSQVLELQSSRPD
jgi:hypothetical protein